VGKTFLIREFFDNDFAFQVTGMENIGKHEQLQNFHTALMRQGSAASTQPSSWFEAFEFLIDLLEGKQSTKRKVVFIDELPWFDTHRSGFISALEHFWNSWASAHHEVMLIVCGSATSWMLNNLIKNHGGLYNRVTRTIALEPFTLKECEEYCKEQGLRYSRYQMIESYMVFGGVPFYLSLMESRLGFAQNVDKLCFEQGAVLRNEFSRLYSSLFKRPEHYVEAVRALSAKKSGLTREALSTALSFADGGTLTKILEELEQCAFIRRYYSFGKKKRDTIYQLIDPFSLFHLNFMEEADKDEDFWLKYSSKGSHNAWAGYAFEQVCFAHVREVKKALGISGILTSVSAWSSKVSTPGAQIDLVIDRDDNAISLCELKYSNKVFTIDADYERKLLHKRAAFEDETKTRKATHLTMVTTYGLRRNSHSGIIQSEVTMDDLF
jgi:hypothetical protein